MVCEFMTGVQTCVRRVFGGWIGRIGPKDIALWVVRLGKDLRLAVAAVAQCIAKCDSAEIMLEAHGRLIGLGLAEIPGLQSIEIIPVHMTSNARSEEHTSELQSLMRISYAVFCLKKKSTYTNISHRNDTLNTHRKMKHYLYNTNIYTSITKI